MAVDLVQTFSVGSVVVSVSFIGLMIFALSVERYRANELLEFYPFTDEKKVEAFPDQEMNSNLALEFLDLPMDY